YNSSSLRQILLLLKWENVTRTSLAADWGLLWVNTIWCLTLWFGLAYLKELTSFSRAALGWMVLEGVLCVLWRGNGRYFGHRYLIGSYAGMSVVFLEIYSIQEMKKILNWGLGVGCFWILFLTWIYQSKIWPWPLIDNWGEL